MSLIRPSLRLPLTQVWLLYVARVKFLLCFPRPPATSSYRHHIATPWQWCHCNFHILATTRRKLTRWDAAKIQQNLWISVKLELGLNWIEHNTIYPVHEPGPCVQGAEVFVSCSFSLPSSKSNSTSLSPVMAEFAYLAVLFFLQLVCISSRINNTAR